MDDRFDAVIEIRQMELFVWGMGAVVGQAEADHYHRDIAFAWLAQLVDHGAHDWQRPAAAQENRRRTETKFVSFRRGLHSRGFVVDLDRFGFS